MFKTLLVVSLAVFGCSAQLDIPKAGITRFGLPLAVPGTLLAHQGVAVAAPAVAAVAPAPILAGLAAPVGAIAVPRPAVALAAPAPLPIPISKIRTQEVLPIQDLGVVNPGPQVVQVRSEQEPVLVHFQSQSAPVQVETSHLPSPPGETTVTQAQDEPHTVIHEIIRPVIQEVREIIQPYRRVTQEIRPVVEEVHTDVATGEGRAAVAAPAVVAAPAPAVAVAAPAPVAVAAPAVSVAAPTFVSTPAVSQAYVTAPLSNGYPATWQRNLFQSIIAPPAPLLTGSYIQSYIDQYGLGRLNTPLIASRPAINVAAPAPAPAVVAAPAPAVAVEAHEPIATEAAAIVPAAVAVKSPKLVGGRLGSVLYTRKYVEYPN